MNYYNEFDPNAAAWLRELIAEGLIPLGDVDDRSIVDVRPGDLRGYRQCHFFTGIAGWPLALQLAGWPEGREVWTGSPPCQPFSVAGKRAGTDDERHLWPVFFNLIRECRPTALFGEQVEAAIRHGWLDLVQDDLEGIGYAFGAAGLPAASVGAPHIRQRLFFVAHSSSEGLEAGREQFARAEREAAERSGAVVRLADTADRGRQHEPQDAGIHGKGMEPGRARPESGAIGGNAGGLADTRRTGPLSSALGRVHSREEGAGARDEQLERLGDAGGVGNADQHGKIGAGTDKQFVDAGCEAGFWSDAIFIPCRDGKARSVPVESVFQCVADGLSYGVDPMRPESGFPLAGTKIEGRAALLKGYGNAIVPQVAAEFIRAVMAA